jgi:hypothetical protein
MRLKIALAFLFIGMLFCFTIAKAETTTEVRQGTVVAVQGNHVIIKMSTGETKEFDVPDDFTVNVDGKDITVKDLKPGTKLTRTISTTTEPKTVYTTEVKNGTVWYASEGTVILTGADGKNRKYDNVPDWIQFEHNGKPIAQSDLKKGMKVSATIVTESKSQVVTTTPGGVSGSAPAEAAAPTAAPAAEPAMAAEHKKLPKTADNYGLLLLLGLSFVAVSWKLR